MSQKKTIYIYTGPTASGKSGLAMQAAEKIQQDTGRQDAAVIINCDSQQVYKELSILSARPTLEDEARVPHALYGHRSIAELYNTWRWREDAIKAIEQAFAKQQIPFLVGGSGLYIKSLIEGLSPIPEVPMRFREEAEAVYDELGAQAFHQKLSEFDAEIAERLEPNDRQRCTRAWSTYQATSKSLSHWQSLPPVLPPSTWQFEMTVLVPNKESLDKKINQRFDEMMAAGAMNEVEAVEALDPHPMMPGLKAHGLPPLRAFLNRKMQWKDAIELAKQQTRHYAKRQMTWNRGQFPEGNLTPQCVVKYLQV